MSDPDDGWDPTDRYPMHPAHPGWDTERDPLVAWPGREQAFTVLLVSCVCVLELLVGWWALGAPILAASRGPVALRRLRLAPRGVLRTTITLRLGVLVGALGLGALVLLRYR